MKPVLKSSTQEHNYMKYNYVHNFT